METKTIEVGDIVRIREGLRSPSYRVTKVYKSEEGVPCADGEGRSGAKILGYSLKNLELIEKGM